MYRHMGGIGDQVARGIEYGAGEIQTLLDIDRIGRVLQRVTHLFGNRHEQIVEDFQHHRVAGRANGNLAGQRLHAGQDQVANRGHLRFPARFDNIGAGPLHNDCGALDLLARGHFIAIISGCLNRFPGHIGSDGLHRFRRGLTGRQIIHRQVKRPANCFDRKGRRNQPLAAHQEAKPRTIGFLKGLRHCVQGPKGDFQCSVGPVIADMNLTQDFRAILWHILADQFLLRLCGHAIQFRVQAAQQPLVQGLLDRAFPHRADIGQAHAIGRQNPREGMDQNLCHAQCIGDQTGMLPPGPTKALQRIFSHVIATLDGDFLNRIGHVFDRDFQESLSNLFGAARLTRRGLNLFRQGGKFLMHRIGIQWLILIGTKDGWEELRLQFPQHHIAISHRQRTTAPIGSRSWIGTCAFGSNAESCAIKLTDRSPARCNSMDQHHGRAHPHTRDQGLKSPLIFAIVMGDIGRGAPHIEGDDLIKACLFRCLHRSDDTARRAGQDGILTLEQLCIGQSAIGLHELQAHIAQFTSNLTHIAPQNGRQIGIHHGGIAAPDKFNQRAGFMAGRNLGKSDVPRQIRDFDFMIRHAIGMHQHNGDRANAIIKGRL